MSGEKPLPWSDNAKAQRILTLLQEKPRTTAGLQDDTPLLHVARQIWELRHWYGYRIKTTRIGGGVALYTLISGEPTEPPASGIEASRPAFNATSSPVSPLRPGAVPAPDPYTCQRCGALLFDLQSGLSPGWLTGTCSKHGRGQIVRERT